MRAEAAASEETQWVEKHLSNALFFALPPFVSQWMEVMGPERVMQNSEGDLGEEERPTDGAQLPVWNGGEEGEEGIDVELDGEEEEEGEEQSGGYYYQPLNQEPGEDGDDRGELQDVQSRIQVSSVELYSLGHMTVLSSSVICR